MSDSVSAPAAPATESAAPVAIFKKRGGAKSKSVRKREPTPPPARDDYSSEDFSSEDESGQRIKRRRITKGTVTASSKAVTALEKDHSTTVFEADRSLALNSANDATKSSTWFDEDVDGALSAKNLLGSSRIESQKKKDRENIDKESNGTYKGLGNQTSYIPKNPNAPKRAVGPIKAPSNIRTVTIMDMAPDVCKDYKRSGFCGFGDSCKFLHARENYLEGWQLDKEWESATKGKKKLAGTIVASADRKKGNEDEFDEDEEAMLQDIPFICIICEEDYKAPITTRCGHYFCERCALQRYRKDPSCAACGAGTNGVFNSAKRLQKLLDKKRERAERRAQQEAEEDEDGEVE